MVKTKTHVQIVCVERQEKDEREREKKKQSFLPLLFMGRTRTATLTLASSRLGSPIVALRPARLNLLPRLDEHPRAWFKKCASRGQLASHGPVP